VIAVDTSSFIAYLSGESGVDTQAVDVALDHSQVVLPPVVLSELLSEPALPKNTMTLFLQLPLLEVLDGYWERTGRLRAKLIARGLRARLADSLIAQSCLDHGVPLVTRDADFHSFVRHGGLRLV